MSKMHRRLKTERIEGNDEGVCKELEFPFAGHGKRGGQKPPEPGSCPQHLVLGAPAVSCGGTGSLGGF